MQRRRQDKMLAKVQLVFVHLQLNKYRRDRSNLHSHAYSKVLCTGVEMAYSKAI